ncbi:hypothetical protein LTR85_010872 [Meristemomyces frigidus]|nr:hypothetical protein LTR85_010872 [Meristemomyces frigidus]
MDLVRLHGVPVPLIHSYSADANNSVGAEYIIMEKVRGKTLRDLWYGLSEKERIRVLSEIVAIEAKLFAMVLPAYGSVYYDRDLPNSVARLPIVTAVSPAGFCMGPNASSRYWYEERSAMDLDRGPHTTSARLMQAAAEKESQWFRQYGSPRLPLDIVYREFTNYQTSQPEEHLQSLERYLQIAPQLVPTQDWLQMPTLRHPDLQPNNIFVSEDFRVTSLIDWQHGMVRPLFLCAGVPRYFQNYGDEESENLVKPSLPENLAELDEDDRELAVEQFRRRHLHFYYLGATATLNNSHLQACMFESGLFRRKIFDHAGEPWEGNNIPLKADLQEAADATLEKLRGFIGISSDGWVSNDRYEHAVQQAALMKKRVTEYAESDFERAMTEAHWPFDDHNEKE